MTIPLRGAAFSPRGSKNMRPFSASLALSCAPEDYVKTKVSPSSYESINFIVFFQKRLLVLIDFSDYLGKKCLLMFNFRLLHF